jgi:hypothetical protein
MTIKRMKLLAATVGGGVVIASAVVGVTQSGDDSGSRRVAGGSGDSATGTSYVQPTLPGMSVNPTAMSTGVTVVVSPPATTLATPMASPSLKATPAPECSNNGQCP